MQTAADIFSAFNMLFLDVAPFVALAAIAVSWIVRNRRYREEEKQLRGRIRDYRTENSAQGSGEVQHEGSEGLH